MPKKINGGKVYQTKYDEYIGSILESNPNIYKYEVPLIIKAFRKTVKYFLEKCIEFEFTDVFQFKRVHKKESRAFAKYRNEFVGIPAHDEMKFSVTKKLKDYLNSRNEFANVRHREKLPDGLTRKNDIF